MTMIRITYSIRLTASNLKFGLTRFPRRFPPLTCSDRSHEPTPGLAGRC